ncbi:RidA family protein [Martelella mediterranea]|uniref:Enamine deaminase RidA (YjgF/YER057c/UK114 family) n=1 Tax=Martelella mediterranea TaxID=293089 RepID=A0A4V2V4W1_9HYPH|nr:RidA family protein [Martelella mediterranea]TCT44461.1 enamine deaminase RidA (YjgF/YER057c/UK114 family) [Martelella mediterranea]
MKIDNLRESPEAKLVQSGLALPPGPPRPVGSFCNVRQSGNLLFVSGQGPVLADGTLLTGKVGDTVSAEEARKHAEVVAINILTALREFCGGSLDQVRGVVKLLGLVNATPEFTRHPYVIDGASNLLAPIFGQSGVHSRSAFGVGSLPNQITVEIEAIFELVTHDDHAGATTDAL